MSANTSCIRVDKLFCLEQFRLINELVCMYWIVGMGGVKLFWKEVILKTLV